MAKRILEAPALMPDMTRSRLALDLKSLHRRYGLYTPCGHLFPDRSDLHFYVEGVGWTCEDALLEVVCQHCCLVDGRQSPQCASTHDHTSGHALCPTMALVDGRESPWSP